MITDSTTTLARVAYNTYGSSTLFRKLLEANEDLYQYTFKEIPPGTNIKVPILLSEQIDSVGDYPWQSAREQKKREEKYPIRPGEDLQRSQGEFLEDGPESVTIDYTTSNIPIIVPNSYI